MKSRISSSTSSSSSTLHPLVATVLVATTAASNSKFESPTSSTAPNAQVSFQGIVPEVVHCSLADRKKMNNLCRVHGALCVSKSCKHYAMTRIHYLTRNPCPWHYPNQCPHKCPLKSCNNAFIMGQELELEIAHSESAAWNDDTKQVERAPLASLKVAREPIWDSESIPSVPLTDKPVSCTTHGWECDDWTCPFFQGNRSLLCQFRKCCWHGLTCTVPCPLFDSTQRFILSRTIELSINMQRESLGSVRTSECPNTRLSRDKRKECSDDSIDGSGEGPPQSRRRRGPNILQPQVLDIPSTSPCGSNPTKSAGVRQLWYADDSSGVGKLGRTIEWAVKVYELGPQYGYFLNPQKTVFVVPKEEVQRVRRYLSNTPFKNAKVQDNGILLGGYMGDKEGLAAFMEKKVDGLCANLSQLTSTAKNCPQELNAAYTSSFQHRWTFLQRTHDVPASTYEPLEKAIEKEVFPSIFRWQPTPVERDIASLPVRKGGLGIINPTHKAASNFEVARKATCKLVEALKGSAPWNPISHQMTFTEASSEHKSSNDKSNDDKVKAILEDATLPPNIKRAFKRANEFKTGQFLQVKPLKRNGATLTKNEFWDGVDLRYAKKPPDLPPNCNACEDKREMSIEHAMTCKKGGGVVGRHFILTNALTTVAEAACWVKNECQVRPPPTTDNGPPALYSDLRISRHKPKDPSKALDIDVRVFYPDAPSARAYSTEALLKKNEVEKINKYKSACTSLGTEFEPFVCTTDGVMAEGAKRVLNTLGTNIAEKWKSSKGVVMSWIKGRMSLAIVRASSACMRGFGRTESREKLQMREKVVGFFDGAALGRLLRNTADEGIRA